MLLFQFILCSLVASVTASRELYIDGSNLAKVEVTTSFEGLRFAYGITSGTFQGKTGLFVSAFKPPAVYFIDTSNGCEKDKSCILTQLVGTGVAGITNGVFSGDAGTRASISDPSRMAFSETLGVVFVMDRTNGLIRFMNLAARTVGTLTSAGQPIQIFGSKLPDNNPELDVKISGEYLYVSDSSWVYNITGADGTLAGALTDAVISPYHALKAWQIENDYERSNKIYLSSIAINPSAGVMYVSYTYRRHAIIVVPLGVGSAADISVLVQGQRRYNPVQDVPVSVNGDINDLGALGINEAYVTFPMHMQYDSETDGIYFVEVFAHFSSGTILGALGSVAVRRLLLGTGMVDYIAGFPGTFRPIYGRETGYVDGYAEIAEFSYPVSIYFVGASVSGNGGLKAYVVDSQNNAIRKLESVTATPHPSFSPTYSMEPTRPTMSPTSAPPTLAPTAAPATLAPSAAPTPEPSISFAPTVYSPPTGQPTELNGECLLFELFDTFGDGWSGARLRVDTPGHENNRQFFAPTSPDPFSFSICSSYLRSDQFGLYPALIDAPDGTETLWEIRWRVTILSSGETYSGDADTLLVFKFDDNGFAFVDSSNSRAEETSSCHRCRHPKPKPKPKSASSGDEDSGDEDSGDEDSVYSATYEMEELVVTQEEYRQLLPGSKPPPPHPKPPEKLFELPFVLHANGGNGWFDPSGGGSSYFVIDENRCHVISEGTICGENLLKDDCAVDLADGDYYFRVTGDGSTSDEEVSWTFCKQRGFARQELSFTMIDGTCYPGVLRDAAVILSSQTSTKFSLSGRILVENVFGPVLSSTDTQAIESGIELLLRDVDTATFDVMVTSTCQSLTGGFCSEDSSSDSSDENSGGEHRRLPKSKPIADGTSTWDVSYLVSLIAEENGVDGTRYSKVVDLSKKVGRDLTDGVLSGDIQDSIRTAAGNSPTLSWIHIKREKPSRLVHINYISTAPPSLTPLAEDEESSGNAERAEQELLSAPIVTVAVDNTGMEYLLLFAVVGLPAIVLAVFFGLKRNRVDELVLGVSAPAQKGGWESVVFNGGDRSPASAISHGISPNELDSGVVPGRSLPYPESLSLKVRKENNSAFMDDLLVIPGRGISSRPQHPSEVVDASNSDRIISPLSRQVSHSTSGSRLTPHMGSNQRDRYRVREGLDHHDLSQSSVRSGLAEVH